jgi:plastocyanin
MRLGTKTRWRELRGALNFRIAGTGFTTLFMAMTLVAMAGCTAVEKPYVIDMTQTNSFYPATIVVPQGAKVIWKNRDHEVHSTVHRPELALHAEAAGGEEAAPLWDSGEVTAGETWERRFDTAGHYLFACRFHDEMIGTVIVTESAPSD